MTLFVLLVLLPALLNLGGLGWLLLGLTKLKAVAPPPTGQLSALPPATVIVAARNEARHLPALLAALDAQTHPKLEILLVNDRSTDSTPEQFAAFAAGRPQCRVLHITETPAGWSPKKWALQQAIVQATAPYVLFTDADCQPPPDWAATLTQHLHQEGGVAVAGFSFPGRAPAAKLGPGGVAAYDSLYTALQYGGAAGHGYPYMAVGRNWGVERATYLHLRPIEQVAEYLSGDDDLVFQQLRKAGRVLTLNSPAAQVPTQTPPTWSSLFRQKIRHLSAGRAYPRSTLAALAVLPLLKVVSVLSALLYLVAGNANPMERLAAAFTAVTGLFVLRSVLLQLGSRHLFYPLSFYKLLIWEPAYMLYQSLFPFLALLIAPKWKETPPNKRTVRRRTKRL